MPARCSAARRKPLRDALPDSQVRQIRAAILARYRRLEANREEWARRRGADGVLVHLELDRCIESSSAYLHAQPVTCAACGTYSRLTGPVETPLASFPCPICHARGRLHIMPGQVPTGAEPWIGQARGHCLEGSCVTADNARQRLQANR